MKRELNSMLSKGQQMEKIERIKFVVDSFLEHESISINQLSREIKIPSSTIQRDLNDIDYISTIYGEKAKEILVKISNRLKENKKHGLSMGGVNSTTNNEPIRDENGKFVGNKKR